MTFKPANKDEQLNLLTAIRKKLLAEIVNRPNLLMQIVHIEPLGVKEAIGDPAPYKDFALQRGEERLTEATIIGFKGQAFTSYPCRWRGTLDEALNLSLDSEKNRAIFVATANALGRLLNLCDRTIHCKDQGPDKCGREMAEYIASQFGSEINIGIVGYQPAIVKHMVNFFGNDRVFVTDLNPDNIGNEVFGVKILNGSSCLVELAKKLSDRPYNGFYFNQRHIKRNIGRFQRIRRKTLHIRYNCSSATQNSWHRKAMFRSNIIV